jgi:hypothetical protein
MMEKHLRKTKEIEALVHGDLILPRQTEIQCYSLEDIEVARHVLSKTGGGWNVDFVTPVGPYPRKFEYVNDLALFIERALSVEQWRGNGLDFDKV